MSSNCSAREGILWYVLQNSQASCWGSGAESGGIARTGPTRHRGASHPCRSTPSSSAQFGGGQLCHVRPRLQSALPFLVPNARTSVMGASSARSCDHQREALESQRLNFHRSPRKRNHAPFVKNSSRSRPPVLMLLRGCGTGVIDPLDTRGVLWTGRWPCNPVARKRPQRASGVFANVVTHAPTTVWWPTR